MSSAIKHENTHHNWTAISLRALLLGVSSKDHLQEDPLLTSKLLPGKLQSALDYDLCCMTTAAITSGNNIHNQLAIRIQENKWLHD